jgi:hypothetical protein
MIAAARGKAPTNKALEKEPPTKEPLANKALMNKVFMKNSRYLPDPTYHCAGGCAKRPSATPSATSKDRLSP